MNKLGIKFKQMAFQSMFFFLCDVVKFEVFRRLEVKTFAVETKFMVQVVQCCHIFK